MADLADVSPGDIITSARQNDITDYIHDGTHKLNTLSVDIGGSEAIDSSKNFIGLSFTDGTLSITGGEILDLTAIEATTTLGIEIGDVQQLVLTDGKLNPTTDSDVDLGDGTHYFKDAYIDTITTTGNVLIGGDLEINQHATFDSEFDNGNSSTADTVDWGVGNYQKSTLTGDCTYTFTAPDGVGKFQLKLIQDGTGTRLVTFPATVLWSGGTAPTLTTDANAIDIVMFYWDGTNYFGGSILDFS